MNSTAHVNDRLRWEYQEANKYDELAWLFPEYGPGIVLVRQSPRGVTFLEPHHTTANEPHHIAGGMFGADRWDLVTNLVHVCRPVHEWCERYRNDGLALCYAVKLIKEEWDAGQMHRITGVPDFSAYLETVEFAFPWVRPALEKCQRLARRSPMGETFSEILCEE